jgi:hypothetical protein
VAALGVIHIRFGDIGGGRGAVRLRRTGDRFQRALATGQQTVEWG